MPILKPPKGAQVKRGRPLARGLVGYWLMNEGGGNKINDLNGNGNTGAIVNAVGAGESFGPCLKLDGTGDYVNGGAGLALNVTECTVLIRFRGSTFPVGYAGLIGRYNTAAVARVWLITASNANLQIWIGNATGSSAVVQATGPTLTAGKEYEVAFTFKDGVGISGLYINGLPYSFADGQTNKSLNTADPAQILEMGSYNGGANNFTGTINWAGIYNRALTAGEIAWLYREPFVMLRRSRLALTTAARGAGAPPAFRAAWAARRHQIIGAGGI